MEAGLQSVLKASPEQVVVEPAASFAVRRHRLPAFDAPWHYHPEYELTLIVASSGTRLVADSIEPFAAGDLVLIGPHLPHCWHSPPGAGRQQAESIVIQFRDDCFGREFFQRPELVAVRRLLDRAHRALLVTGPTRDQAAREMAALVEARGVRRVTGLLALLELLAQSPELRPLASAAYAPQLDQRTEERIARAYTYVLEQFAGEVELAEAARRAGLSLAAFCRTFKRATRTTFSELVNEVRIGHACKLLLEGEQDVGGVAHACGYRTLSHFNHQFRRRKGLSPREFRRRHRAAARG
jgi:AraC-like DNA-binding protein